MLLLACARHVRWGPILLLLGLLETPRAFGARLVFLALLRARLHADFVPGDRARFHQDKVACHARLVTFQAQRAPRLVPHVMQIKAPSQPIAPPAFQGCTNGRIQEYTKKT